MTSTPSPKTVRADRLQDGVLVAIVLLVGIMAGAASFTHVHDWTIKNSPAGTPDWFGWANAVISELIPTAALITIGKRRRNRISVRYPMVLLVAAVAVSLTAQLAVATPTVFGWMVSALPALAFFALSKLVFTATTPRPTTNPVTVETPATSPAPSTPDTAIEVRPATAPTTRATTPTENSSADKTTPPAEAQTTTAPARLQTTPAATPDGPAPAPVASDQRIPARLLTTARAIATSHRATHGADINPNQLAVRLRVPSPIATDILTHLRDNPTTLNGHTIKANA